MLSTTVAFDKSTNFVPLTTLVPMHTVVATAAQGRLMLAQAFVVVSLHNPASSYARCIFMGTVRF